MAYKIESMESEDGRDRRKYTIPTTNWLQVLGDAVVDSLDGDVVVVSSEEMAELGKRALARMCPGKEVTFEVVEPFSDYPGKVPTWNSSRQDQDKFLRWAIDNL